MNSQPIATVYYIYLLPVHDVSLIIVKKIPKFDRSHPAVSYNDKVIYSVKTCRQVYSID